MTLASDKFEKLISVLPADSSLELYRRLLSHSQTTDRLVPGTAELPLSALQLPRTSALERPLLQMQYLDTVFYLPNDILVKLDRAAMSVGLETRAPFLDHRIAEFAWRLPDSYRVGGGAGKRILRLLLRRYLPDELVERPKAGFALPIGAWLRTPGRLRGWAEDLLAEQALRSTGVLDPAEVRQIWKEHLSGRHNRQYQLWDILMLQAWLLCYHR
jgi:asparagine synthase (glutamine-hydrolysing)